MRQSVLLSYMWIVMPVVIIVLGIGIAFISIFITQHAEHIVENDFGDKNSMILALLEERALYIIKANLSVHHVASIIDSVFQENFSISSTIEINVAPSLFMALKTIQLASQISFVSVDHVVFSYFQEKDQTFALFLNSSSMIFNSTLPNQWNAEQVDELTGKGLGNSFIVPRIEPNDSKWYSAALQGRSMGPSYGYRWGNSRDQMFFFTAPIDRVGVVAIGIALKDFIDYLFSSDLHDACAYVFTKDGILLEFVNSTSKECDVGETFSRTSFTSDACMATIDWDKLVHPSTQHGMVEKERFKVECVPISVAEIQLVILVTFPWDNVVPILQEVNITTVLLLSSFILIATVGSCIQSKLLRRLLEQKNFILANLIKQKEATEQAERKSMNKSIAFANASHDVRASLAGITGLIRLCQEDISSGSDISRNLLQMNVCTSKLLGILNSVLDTSKVEAGKMQLEQVEFSMAQAIEESVDMFHVVALDKGLEVIWDPCDFSVFACSNVRGDCRIFKQILDNLLSNAVKFTSKGHVIVRAWVKKVSMKDMELTSIQKGWFSHLRALVSSWFCSIGHVDVDKQSVKTVQHDQSDLEFVFEIDDTGIGIPKDKRASVFENYVQVKESTSGYEGTGLGLGIVQSYVRLMGGDIGIKEKEPSEKGCCFIFNIFMKSNGAISNNLEGEDVESSTVGQFQSSSSKTRGKVQSNICFGIMPQAIGLEGLSCQLLIHGGETRRILQAWMRTLGVKVIVAKQPENLLDALKLTSQSSSVSSRGPSIPSSVDNGDFLSARDDGKQVLSISIKDVFKKTSLRVSPRYLLVVLDLSFRNVYAMHSFLAFLAKGPHPFQEYKVVCLTDSSSSGSRLPCDVILHKPIHGSRICKILELMLEFGQSCEERISQDARDICSTSNLESRSLLSSSPSSQKKVAVLHDINEQKPLSGLNILLVEDAIILRQIASKFLSRSGANVRLANNGLEALNVVKKALEEGGQNSQGSSWNFPFDLILMDIQMPVMDGYEATKCIRIAEKQYGLHVPILALTAHATPDETKAILHCGMDFHLTKPIEIDKLLEAILLISQS
ncbi:hypothetical protein HPP92_019785 [Vanilla planifolia]|uniref:histidine kinase n=1 Tax=Vanilla planifolia TaxID=51239 RepID=A0A835Q013_VANPL|nr:hypothetical protein HPP92_019785 [Vanilla planifolia]